LWSARQIRKDTGHRLEVTKVTQERPSFVAHDVKSERTDQLSITAWVSAEAQKAECGWGQIPLARTECDRVEITPQRSAVVGEDEISGVRVAVDDSLWEMPVRGGKLRSGRIETIS